MEVSIGCSAHRKHSEFAILDGQGQVQRQERIIHEPGDMREFLADFFSRHFRCLGERIGELLYAKEDVSRRFSNPEVVTLMARQTRHREVDLLP